MKSCDLLVVGAGIHGAGVAQAAAALGHRVIVIEKSAIAHGTSSRSSKLIHGGLRYLESGQFRLVRESLQERRILLRIAPELVRLQSFFVPIYANTRRRPWQLRAGLALYALLGGFDRHTHFGTLAPRRWPGLDGLRQDGLETVFRYFDAQTDDALLTRAVIGSAQDLGAELLLPAELVDAELGDEGVTARVRMGSDTLPIAARVIVNAAGPWAPRVAATVHPALPPTAVELVQGTHIVVPQRTSRGVYYVESPRDGRAIFVMPWQGRTLVGTTETAYRGDPEQVRPLPEEEDYLLEVLAHYFPAHAAMTRDDIVARFAGLRVLPVGRGRAFGRSREMLLATDRRRRPRFLSVLGGKLTGWRAAAALVVERIAASLPAPTRRADTTRLRLRLP